MLWSLSGTLVESTDWHTTDVAEWGLCRAGSGRLETESLSVVLQPGRTLLISPGVRHRFVFGEHQGAELKVVCMSSADMATYLSPAQIAQLESVRAAGISYADHGSRLPDVQRLAELINDKFNITDARDLVVAWGAVGILLALHIADGEIPGDLSCRRYRQRISEIKVWIDENLEEAIAIDDVCETFGLSRSVFTREFRRYTGKSFIDYCNGRRVERAAAILLSGGESITEAALQSGFSNLSHFHRQFKAIYGITPAAFRRQVVGGPEH
jgi:AraC-like DNA-binding protein